MEPLVMEPTLLGMSIVVPVAVELLIELMEPPSCTSGNSAMIFLHSQRNKRVDSVLVERNS